MFVLDLLLVLDDALLLLGAGLFGGYWLFAWSMGLLLTILVLLVC